MAPLAAERKVRLAARAAIDHQALDPLILDLQGLSSVTDYFLVCSGRSTTHVRSLADAIREEMKAADVRALHAEGTPESGWMLLDYGDVLVHVCLEATRVYYALERLWGDALSVPMER